MFKQYDFCIFCFKSLPKPPKGEGEHVIPKNVYGFWRIYDICEECKKYFGDNVDHLAIKNVHIVHAMHDLVLPKSDKFLDSLPYYSTDVFENRKVKMVRKDGKYKTKVKTDGDRYLECSEEDWEIVGVEWLKKFSNISKEEFNKEIERLRQEYNKLRPGQIIHSNLLQCYIRKSQTKNVEYDKEALPDISQLIAKIVISFLSYLLAGKQIVNINQYKMLLEHARYGHPLEKFVIGFLPPREETKFFKFHRIAMSCFSNILMVDVTFFGNLTWRTSLRCKSPITINLDTGRVADEVMLILDFEDLNNRQKVIGYKYSGTEEFDFYDVIF